MLINDTKNSLGTPRPFLELTEILPGENCRNSRLLLVTFFELYKPWIQRNEISRTNKMHITPLVRIFYFNDENRQKTLNINYFLTQYIK